MANSRLTRIAVVAGDRRLPAVGIRRDVPAADDDKSVCRAGPGCAASSRWKVRRASRSSRPSIRTARAFNRLPSPARRSRFPICWACRCLSGNIAAERPGRFRLTAGTAVTGQEIDLGSNDELFWMWVRRNQPPAVYFCRHDNLRTATSAR